MAGPGEEFSRGHGGHGLCRGVNDLTQPSAQGLVGQKPLSHPDTMATCVLRSSEPGRHQSPRKGEVNRRGLAYFMLKYTASSCPSQVPSIRPCPSCSIPILCSSPDIPFIFAPHQGSQPPPALEIPWLSLPHPPQQLGFLPEN